MGRASHTFGLRVPRNGGSSGGGTRGGGSSRGFGGADGSRGASDSKVTRSSKGAGSIGGGGRAIRSLFPGSFLDGGSGSGVCGGGCVGGRAFHPGPTSEVEASQRDDVIDVDAHNGVKGAEGAKLIFPGSKGDDDGEDGDSDDEF